MALMKVLSVPDPILKKKALPVEKVDGSIRKLMDDMLETMYEDRGVGLAANQVGVLKRVLVIDLQDDEDQERPKGFYPLYLVNPEITEYSKETLVAAEGCMSVPGQRVDVRRPKSITFKYLDYNGKEQEIATDGWLARCVQHEIDHLDGKTLLDYVSKLKQSVLLRKINKFKRFVA